MCGPIAAAGVAAAFGVQTDPGQLAKVGQDNGWWNPSQGMSLGSGIGVAKLLRTLGIDASVLSGQKGIQRAIDTLGSGTPVILNFPDHYLLAQDYDPKTGAFFVGATGSNALRGGSDWMTLDQIAALPGAGGALRSLVVPTQQAPSGGGSGGFDSGTPAAQAPAGTSADSGSPQAFVNSLLPVAESWAQKSGIPTDYLLAAAAHESGWGSTPGNMLFGIKGPGTSQQTWEMVNGTPTPTTASFATYPDANSAFADFVHLVTQGRYAGAYQRFQQSGDPAQFFRDLTSAGYATDPAWGDKIARMASSNIAPLLANATPTENGFAPTAADQSQPVYHGQMLPGDTSGDQGGISPTNPMANGYTQTLPSDLLQPGPGGVSPTNPLSNGYTSTLPTPLPSPDQPTPLSPLAPSWLVPPPVDRTLPQGTAPEGASPMDQMPPGVRVPDRVIQAGRSVANIPGNLMAARDFYGRPIVPVDQTHAEQIVDSLNRTAGITPTPQERDRQVSQYMADTQNFVAGSLGGGGDVQAVGTAGEAAQAAAALPSLRGKAGGAITPSAALRTAGSAVGAGIGYEATPEGSSPQDYARNMILGGLGGYALTRGGEALASRFGSRPLTRAEAAAVAQSVTDPAEAERQLAAVGAEARPGSAAPRAPQAMSRLGTPPRTPSGVLPGPERPAAPPLPPTPGAPLVGKAGNLNLEKFPEEIRPLIQQTYQAAPDAAEAMRRGVLPDAVVAQKATEVNLSRLKYVNPKAGTPYTAEEVVAIRNGLDRSYQKVIDLTKAGDDSTAGLLKLNVALAEAQALQKTATGAAAEAGRALRAHRQAVDRALSINDPKLMQRVLAQLGGDTPNKQLLGLLQDAVQHEDGVTLGRLVQELNKPSLMQHAQGYYAFNLLSRPVTSIRNILGNTTSLLLDLPETAASAGVEHVLAPLQGRAPERSFSEVAALPVAWWSGIRDAGWGSFKNILTHGFDPSNLAKLPDVRGELPGGSKNPANYVFRFMEGTDSLFQSMSKAADLRKQAIRIAASEGLKGTDAAARVNTLITTPTEAMLNAAQDAAKYRTYRQDMDGIGKALTGLQNAHPLMRFVLPFVRTPYNILRFELERTPLAGMKIAKDVAAGQYRGASAKSLGDLSDRLARFLIGGGITWSAVQLYNAGMLTGNGPSDPGQRQLWLKDHQPFSVKVGGRWLDYNQFTGVAGNLAAVTTALDALQRNDLDAGQKASAAFMGLLASLTNRPFLTGWASLVDAIQTGQREGNLNVFTRPAEQIAQGLVPASALLRGIQAGTDTAVRQANGLSERLQSGLPGVGNQLPPKLDALGQPIPQQGADLGQPGQLANSLFNPIRSLPDTENPAAQELLAQGVNAPSTARTIGGQALTADQQYQYQELARQAFARAVTALQANPQYQALPDAQKQNVLEQARMQAEAQARAQVMNSGNLMPADGHPPRYDLRALPPQMRDRYQGNGYLLEQDVAAAVRAIADFRAARGQGTPPTREQQILASLVRSTPTIEWRKWYAQQQRGKPVAARQRIDTRALIDQALQPVGSAPP